MRALSASLAFVVALLVLGADAQAQTRPAFAVAVKLHVNVEMGWRS